MKTEKFFISKAVVKALKHNRSGRAKVGEVIFYDGKKCQVIGHDRSGNNQVQVIQ